MLASPHVQRWENTMSTCYQAAQHKLVTSLFYSMKGGQELLFEYTVYSIHIISYYGLGHFAFLTIPDLARNYSLAGTYRVCLCKKFNKGPRSLWNIGQIFFQKILDDLMTTWRHSRRISRALIRVLKIREWYVSSKLHIVQPAPVHQSLDCAIGFCARGARPLSCRRHDEKEWFWDKKVKKWSRWVPAA